MLDRDDLDDSSGFVDGIDDAVVAAPCAVEPFEVQPQRRPDSVRVGRHGRIEELDRRGGDLLRELGEVTTGGR